jgi:DNA-damage-inducible protein D
MKNDLVIFEGAHIRRLYDEKTETWYFSVVDILQVLFQQPDHQTAL